MRGKIKTEEKLRGTSKRALSPRRRNGINPNAEPKNRRTESLPYGGRRYFPNRSLCVPVRAKVSTSTSSSMR